MVKEEYHVTTNLEDDTPSWDYLKNNQDKKWTIEVKVYDSEGAVLDTMLYSIDDVWSMCSEHNEKYNLATVGDGDTMKIYKEAWT